MAQLFQTNFDSFDGLEQVVKTIEQFSPERFQYAIFNTHHRLKTTEIQRLDCRVTILIMPFPWALTNFCR